MTRRYLRKAGRLTAAVLSASLLISCAPASPAPSKSADYEQYHAGSAADHTERQFDEFLQNLYVKEVTKSGIDLHYSLADPSTRGITDFPAAFGEFGVEVMKKDMEEAKQTLKQLETFPVKNLSDSQKLTFQILDTLLETELSGEGFELYSEPLSSTIGIQAQLPVLLAEYSFYTRADVDNYLSLLSTIDTFYGQIMEFEKQKSAAGLFMSDRAADHVLESCEAYLVQPEYSFLNETFHTRIDELTDISEEEKQAYKDQNLKVLKEHFIPAYQLLINGVTALMGTGRNDKGLYYLPDGPAFYEYLVASNVAPSYRSVKALKEAVEDKINKDLKSMSEITSKHPEVLDELDGYAFRYTEPADCLNTLKEQITGDYPELPENSYTVKYVPKALESSLSPAFYLVPPLDRYQDNVIYINQGKSYSNTDLFTTLAHEGYPGHLYQNVYFISQNNCDLRSIMSFSSYSEGWATYVENCSYTMDNGLGEQLGELLAHNNSVNLGLYAYLDISINYDGWDKDKVQEFLSTYYDIADSEIVDGIFDALVENPTNYLEYYVGYLEIDAMRGTAEKVLKDRFDLKAFHKFLLDIGPAQFSVIQPKFLVWLTDQRKNG